MLTRRREYYIRKMSSVDKIQVILYKFIQVQTKANAF